MKAKEFAPLVAVVMILSQGCLMTENEPPTLADGLRLMVAAMDEAVAVGLDGAVPYMKTKSPWQCDQAQKRSFSYSYDIKSKDPRAAVKAVRTHWRSRGYRVQEDNSDAPAHPEVYADVAAFELSIVGFPEREEVWVHGNTVCLPGEVPEEWRDVR